MKRLLILILLPYFTISVLCQNNLNKEKWEFKKVSGDTLIFANNIFFKTNLYHLDYIDQINIPEKSPYLLFTGVDCTNCGANNTLYVHSADDGEFIVGSGLNTYSLPGKEYYYLNDSLIYEARVFYGKILNDKFGIIWYQKTLQDSNIWEHSTYILELSKNKPKGTFLSTDSLINKTLELVSQNNCKELEGEIRTSEP
ncbi:hypothetical protein ACE1ET_20140 [Saccharicrinis sp. FJH62]|uniref:hypothetical protein n=1 Tax=Saccharicrinis sp. FJH62 TaxID=3344657 RepID=UPI0035D4C57F